MSNDYATNSESSSAEIYKSNKLFLTQKTVDSSLEGIRGGADGPAVAQLDQVLRVRCQPLVRLRTHLSEQLGHLGESIPSQGGRLDGGRQVPAAEAVVDQGPGGHAFDKPVF